MKWFYLPIWVFFSFCIFYKMTIVRYKKVQCDYFNKCYTGRIKGVLALIILLDHIAALIPVQGDIVFDFFHAIGFLAVAMFFFFSGYSVEKQKIERDDYLNKKFILKKIVSIIIPLYLVNMLYVLGEILVKPWNIDLSNWRKVLAYIFDITGHFVINVPTWYVRSLFLLLVVYWTIHKIIKKQNYVNVAMFIVILIITLYKALSWENGTGQEWGMLFCFLIGNIWAQNEERILSLINKKYFITLIVSGISTICFCGLFLFNYDNLFGKLFMRNLGTGSFVVLLTLLLMTIRIENKFCDLLGKISLEIYLMHSLVIGFAIKFLEVEWIKVYGVLIASILVAYIIHIILSRLVKFIYSYI